MSPTRRSVRSATRHSQTSVVPNVASAPFDLPDLYSALHELLAQVPRGRVTTYGDLAEALGTIKAARWVATYLLHPGGPADLPRHRVVSRSGAIGKFRTGRPDENARRLLAEGIVVNDETVDVERYGFCEFIALRPLEKMFGIQEELATKIRLRPLPSPIEFAAGVDVSYAGSAAAGPVTGVAAYAMFHVASGELVWIETIRRQVDFPYIPGLLAFRELPILLELLRQVRADDRMADVILVDGNGILHQRSAGIASHLGVLAGVPTIGVGKSLLCGTVDLKDLRQGELRPVHYQNRCVAQAQTS